MNVLEAKIHGSISSPQRWILGGGGPGEKVNPQSMVAPTDLGVRRPS